MGTIVFAVLAFIFGWWMVLADFSSSSDEFYYRLIGGIVIPGSVYAFIRGVKEVQAQGRLAAISERHSDLTSRLRQEHSLDQIATDYHTKHGIPIASTLMHGGTVIQEWVESNDPGLQSLAKRLIARQHVHATCPPEEFLDRLGSGEMAIYYDDTALAYMMPPSLGQNIHALPESVAPGFQGTLVLSAAYLYFFAMKRIDGAEPVESVGSQIWNAIGDLPVIGHGTKGVDALAALHSGFHNVYSKERLDKLKARFRSDGSFAVPLRRIVALRATEMFEPVGCLEIEFKIADQAEATTHWFASRLVTSSFGEGQRRWTDDWIRRVKLAAIAEGNNLITQQEPAKGRPQ